jgi:predicted alpha/beta-fold hydrolase
VSESNWLAGFRSFHPRPWLRNAHLQTIMGNLLPRTTTLPAPEAQLVEVAPARGSQMSSQVLCECHWQPLAERSSLPTVILLHGLEGSAHSQYVVGNADKLWHAGCNVVRMNMRNCGGTERLTPTLYHSGLSADVEQVMHFFIETYALRSISLVGYSMGGNLVMKLAGDLGGSAPHQLRSVVGVSPAVDLAASADALHVGANSFYERRFLRSLVKRFRRKAALFPNAFDPARSAGIGSVREFDDRITALYSGFQSADDYYFRAAAALVLDRIAVPTLVIHAADDPFIRFTEATRSKITANLHIQWLETTHGGHCAFLATPNKRTGDDGYWAEHTALQFILANA